MGRMAWSGKEGAGHGTPRELEGDFPAVFYNLGSSLHKAQVCIGRYFYL